MIRRRPVQRLTSLIIGAIVTAIGGITIAVLSGKSIDMELVWIIGLAVVGGWLLLTAIMAGLRGDDATPIGPGPQAVPPTDASHMRPSEEFDK